MTFEWPIFRLRSSGILVYDDNGVPYPNAPRFATSADAEAWLVAEDIRGNVRESVAEYEGDERERRAQMA